MNILIFNPLHIFFDENSLYTTACGGSETWAIQLANAFLLLGHLTYVVCYCKKSHKASNNVMYVDRNDLVLLSLIKFDFAICSRIVLTFYNVLNILKFTDRFFIMLSDTSCPDATPNVFDDSRCKKIVTLTEWHKQLIQVKYNLDDSRLCIIPNGIDPKLFEFIESSDTKRDNSILWSSRAERGLEILSEHIAPIVRLTIPDFTVYAATYSDDPNFDYSKLNVVQLPAMSKCELYKEMSKHRVWFYPSTFDETFCITVIENMMCENDIVIYPLYGTTEFKPMINSLSYSFDNKNFDVACQNAAAHIIECINKYDDESHISLRKTAKNQVLSLFTWNNVANKFIGLCNE